MNLSKLKYLLVGTLFLAGCAVVGVGHMNKPILQPKDGKEFGKVAVMITAMSRRSGGTGVILDSRPSGSTILTNKHVCQLVQVGGLVIDDRNNTYPVESFRVYKKHDLCLITVQKDLGVNIKIADRAPEVYSGSVVVGHPALLPTMITPGHFSQSQIISLIVDMEPCDGTEKDDDAIMCLFAGGKPVTKSFRATATSSLIMPGSSGSGVFNEKGELAGLIFAGNQGLGYGFLVPWEYVRDFLIHREHYPVQYPNAMVKPSNFFTSYFKFQKICEDKISYVLDMQEMCKAYPSLGLWHE